jgi:hypothetical protein
MKDLTEHNVPDKSKSTDFRTYDLILAIEKNDIVVYRISDTENREQTFNALRTYPTPDQIESMTFKKDGVLL